MLSSILEESLNRIRSPFVDFSYLYSYIPDIISSLNCEYPIYQQHITRNPFQLVRSWYTKLKNEIYPTNSREPPSISGQIHPWDNYDARKKFWPYIPEWMLYDKNDLVEKICFHYIATNMPVLHHNNSSSAAKVPLCKFEDVINNPFDPFSLQS